MKSADSHFPTMASAVETPIPLPAGRYSLTRALDDRVRRISGAPPGGGVYAHPIMAFVSALGGMGVAVAEVCRLCGSDIALGPVLASTGIVIERPLLVDRNYAIAGVVTQIVRKLSRRYGVADHVTLDLTVTSDGERHAMVTLSWVMPACV